VRWSVCSERSKLQVEVAWSKYIHLELTIIATRYSYLTDFPEANCQWRHGSSNSFLIKPGPPTGPHSQRHCSLPSFPLSKCKTSPWLFDFPSTIQDSLKPQWQKMGLTLFPIRGRRQSQNSTTWRKRQPRIKLAQGNGNQTGRWLAFSWATPCCSCPSGVSLVHDFNAFRLTEQALP
jgi:hypothetical protein